MSDTICPECAHLAGRTRLICRGEFGDLAIANQFRASWGLPPLPADWVPPVSTPEEIARTAAPWDLSMPSRGLGDTVAKVLHATGGAKVAQLILGKSCGCPARQARWNRRWPYRHGRSVPAAAGKDFR